MSGRLRMGVVGTGAMGRHHVRILSELADADLVGIYDQRSEVAAERAAAHGTQVFASPAALADAVDAVVLAVPTVEHASLGCDFLARGCHLLVEKPIASSLEEAGRMIAVAADHAKVLAVGHVEFFNPGVQAVLAQPGPVRFVEIQRLSPFTPRSLDVDVILDLMIHDIQILHALDPSPIAEIRASGIDVMSAKVDMTHARIALESGAVATISASRVASEPVRKLRLFGQNSYYSLDYREQEVKGYGLEFDGDQRRIVPAQVEVVPQEPLVGELRAFVDACLGRKATLVDGAQGRRALATALAVRDAVG